MQTKRYLRTPVLSLAVLSGLLSASTLYGAGYLKIGDIKGESTDAAHREEIDVLSWSWGMSNAAVSGGGGAGKANFQDISCVKELDKSSPKLAEAIATGAVIPEARIALTRGDATGGQSDYLTIILRDVVVTSLNIQSGSADPRPTEQISLNYSKIEFSYTPQRQDGSLEPPVVFAWDVAANSPIDPTAPAGN